jgi:hypothetical protein
LEFCLGWDVSKNSAEEGGQSIVIPLPLRQVQVSQYVLDRDAFGPFWLNSRLLANDLSCQRVNVGDEVELLTQQSRL